MHAGILIDRSIRVQPGQVVHTGYVHVDNVRLGCKAPLAIGDVERKYEIVRQNAPAQVFPCPVGVWEGERFTIHDGRHTYLAHVMNGFEYVLVAWTGDVADANP